MASNVPSETAPPARAVFIAWICNLPINTGGGAISHAVCAQLCSSYAVTHLFFESRDTRGRRPKVLPYKLHKIVSRWTHVHAKLPKQVRGFALDCLFDRRALRDIHCDLIYLSAPFLYPVAKYISDRNRHARIVMLAHNIEWQYYKNAGNPLWPLLRLYENWVHKKVDQILCIAEQDYAALRIAHGDKVQKINPVLATEPQSDTPDIEYDRDYFNLVFFGNLSNQMGRDSLEYIKGKLIPALKQAHLRVKINIFGNGQLDPQFADDMIVHHGFVDDPDGYIRAADLMIFPIFNDAGIKIRVLESIQCGQTILATPEAMRGLNPTDRAAVIECDSTAHFVAAIEAQMRAQPEAT